MAQVQDGGCLRMQLTQLKTALSPAPAVGCVLTPVLWWVLRSHGVAWRGPEPLPCPRPPAPDSSPIKGLSCSALLTGGVMSRGGAMDFVSIQQLVRTCSGGRAVVWAPPDRLSRTRRPGSSFLVPEEVLGVETCSTFPACLPSSRVRW